MPEFFRNMARLAKGIWKSGSKSAHKQDEAFNHGLRDEEFAYMMQFEDEPTFFQASYSSTRHSAARFPGTKSVVVTETVQKYLRVFGINLEPRACRIECSICTETRPHSSFISTTGCAHEYCSKCCKRHAETIIKSGSSQIKCPHPNCGHSFNIDQCRSLLTRSNFNTLNIRLTEGAIPASLRVYCPFRDCPGGCSVFMEKSESHGTFAECYFCHRGICQECNVPWHADQTCGEYRAIEMNTKQSGDQKFRDLAKQEKWQNCRECLRFVERASGCKHMTCVCKNEFCYLCGKKYINKAASCKC